MQKLEKLLQAPAVLYLIIGGYSLVPSLLFWVVDGGKAELDSKNYWGFSIHLTGGIVGFIAVFTISLKMIERLHKLRVPPLKTFIVSLLPRDFFAKEEEYLCHVKIFDDESGEYRTVDIEPMRVAGHLTIALRELKDSERYRIEIKNSANMVWRSEYCHPFSPKTEMAAI